MQNRQEARTYSYVPTMPRSIYSSSSSRQSNGHHDQRRNDRLTFVTHTTPQIPLAETRQDTTRQGNSAAENFSDETDEHATQVLCWVPAYQPIECRRSTRTGAAAPVQCTTTTPALQLLYTDFKTKQKVNRFGVGCSC